jgi:hypothetical protein
MYGHVMAEDHVDYRIDLLMDHDNPPDCYECRAHGQDPTPFLYLMQTLEPYSLL